MAELAPLVDVVAVGGAYVVASRRRAPVPVLVRASFLAGLLTVAVALASPLDAAAATSLTAHMVQHVLLLVVAPPLLVVGDPRVLLRLTSRRARASAAGSGAVAAAIALQSFVMWAWHAPRAYELATHHLVVHVAEHLTFLAAGVLLWWVLVRPGRGPHPAAAPLLFVACLPGVALGAALTLAARPWYPSYGDLGDQQLAGVVMWAFGGAVYVLAAFVAFARWLSAEGDGEAVPT